MSNKYITCKDCNRTFIVPEWEQKVYQANEKPIPTCCSTCRKERREIRQALQKTHFTVFDFYFWMSIMKNQIPFRRDTKHPTDDFRGWLGQKKNS